MKGQLEVMVAVGGHGCGHGRGHSHGGGGEGHFNPIDGRPSGKNRLLNVDSTQELRIFASNGSYISLVKCRSKMFSVEHVEEKVKDGETVDA